MANEIENGVYLSPTTGNVVATGIITSNGLQVDSPDKAMFGNQSLPEIIQSYSSVKANADSLADAYSDTTTYAVGDAVTHDGNLYKCKTAITVAEEWNKNHWYETTVATLWNNADTTFYGGQN